MALYPAPDTSPAIVEHHKKTIKAFFAALGPFQDHKIVMDEVLAQYDNLVNLYGEPKMLLTPPKRAAMALASVIIATYVTGG